MLKPQAPAKAGLIIALAGILRAGLGYLSQALIAAKFGASAETDAYFVSITIPTLLGDFTLGGVLGVVLIPVFIEYKLQKGEREAWEMISIVLNFAFFLLLFCLLIYFFFISPIVFLIAPGFKPPVHLLAVRLSKIVSPMLLFFGLSVIFTSLLHAHQHFTIPAIAPLFYSLVVIFSVLLLSAKWGIYSVAFGALTGAFLAALAEWKALTKTKPLYNFSVNLNHPGVKKILKLALPVLLGTLLGQFWRLVQRNLASGLGEGCVSALNFATLVMTVPHMILLAPIGTVIFPYLSKVSASGNLSELRQAVSNGLRLVIFLCLPATAILVVFRLPVIQLLFQRGSFDFQAAQLTATALLYLSLGLFALAANTVLFRTFYALQDMTNPLKVSAVGVVFLIVVSLTLTHLLGLAGLTLAYSLYVLFIFLVLFWRLESKHFSLDKDSINICFLKTSLASFAMSGMMLLCKNFFDHSSSSNSIGFLLSEVFFGAIGGIVIFVLFAFILRMRELTEALLMVKVRLSRFPTLARLRGTGPEP